MNGTFLVVVIGYIQELPSETKALVLYYEDVNDVRGGLFPLVSVSNLNVPSLFFPPHCLWQTAAMHKIR